MNSESPAREGPESQIADQSVAERVIETIRLDHTGAVGSPLAEFLSDEAEAPSCKSQESESRLDTMK